MIRVVHSPGPWIPGSKRHRNPYPGSVSATLMLSEIGSDPGSGKNSLQFPDTEFKIASYHGSGSALALLMAIVLNMSEDTHLSGQASEEVDLLARMLAERVDLTHPLLLTVGAKQLDIPTIKDLVAFVAENF
jgi:hypothetical protein